MQPSTAVEEGEILRLLTEIGFAAAGHGMEREAARIFDAMAKARPDSAVADIGQALIAMGARRFDQAVQLLWRDALGKEPDNRDVKRLLGLALQLAGRGHDSARFLEEAGGAGMNGAAPATDPAAPPTAPGEKPWLGEKS